MNEIKINKGLKDLPTIDYRVLENLQGDLKTLPKNELKKLKTNIAQEFTFPFYVWINKGRKYIEDGHQRQKALQSLEKDGYKIPELPYIEIVAKNKKEAVIKLLQLNSQYGQYNADTTLFTDLEISLPEFEELNLSLDFEFNCMAPTTGGDGNTDPDNVPETPEEPVIKTGDLVMLGNHRILCGDSTKKEDVERLMAGEKVDMVFTDPPYNVDYEGNYIQSGRILKKKDKVWSGGIENDNRNDFGEWLNKAYVNINKFLKNGCSIYIWHPSGEDCKYFWSAWPFDLWHFQVDIIWNKLSLIINRWDYKPQHEPCMYGWKGKNREWEGPNNESTVWNLARQQGASGEKRHHPTQKPVELAERAINNHKANIVLDGFLGSGSTLIACETTGRACRGLEIDPGYIETCIKRYELFVGSEQGIVIERDGKMIDWRDIKKKVERDGKTIPWGELK